MRCFHRCRIKFVLQEVIIKIKTMDMDDCRHHSRETLVCVIQDDDDIHPNRWTSHSINALLVTRLSMEKEFANPKCLKRKLWNTISQIMHENGYDFSAEACDSKYRNLLGTYRTNKKKLQASGDSTVKWEYYNMIDEVIGNKINVDSFESLNFIPQESETKYTEGSDDEQPLAKKKKTTDYESTLNDYWKFKTEHEVKKEEAKERRWQQKVKLKMKEIEAINNLARVLAQQNKST